MHIFWLNDGVHLSPDNQEEHDALVLLWKNCQTGRPANFSGQPSAPGTSEEGAHVVVGNEELPAGPLRVARQLGAVTDYMLSMSATGGQET